MPDELHEVSARELEVEHVQAERAAPEARRLEVDRAGRARVARRDDHLEGAVAPFPVAASRFVEVVDRDERRRHAGRAVVVRSSWLPGTSSRSTVGYT